MNLSWGIKAMRFSEPRGHQSQGMPTTGNREKARSVCACPDSEQTPFQRTSGLVTQWPGLAEIYTSIPGTLNSTSGYGIAVRAASSRESLQEVSWGPLSITQRAMSTGDQSVWKSRQPQQWLSEADIAMVTWPTVPWPALHLFGQWDQRWRMSFSLHRILAKPVSPRLDHPASGHMCSVLKRNQSISPHKGLCVNVHLRLFVTAGAQRISNYPSIGDQQTGFPF